MRTAIENGTDQPNEKKEPRWDEKHPVCQQLKEDIIKKVIPFSMTVEAAKQVREEYKQIPDDLWKSRLESLRVIVQKKMDDAAQDAFDLANDRLKHPKSSVNLMGKPEWDDSEAQICLDFDIDESLHEQMQPQELWLSRDQYQEFELDDFRGPLYQELHSRKWRAQRTDGKKDYALVPELDD